MGDRAHGKCAVARTHQRYRRRSRKARDAARGAEFADRGHAGGGTGDPADGGATGQWRSAYWRGNEPCRSRRRRDAGRTDPGAAVPRLPRPAAATKLMLPHWARRGGRLVARMSEAISGNKRGIASDFAVAHPGYARFSALFDADSLT